MITNEIPRGSVDYVSGPVTAADAATGAPIVLDTQVVKIALTQAGATHAWLPAGWVGTAGSTRTARTSTPVTFAGDEYPAGQYGVYVQVTDTAEIPIIRIGTIQVTGT